MLERWWGEDNELPLENKLPPKQTQAPNKVNITKNVAIKEGVGVKLSCSKQTSLTWADPKNDNNKYQ